MTFDTVGYIKDELAHGTPIETILNGLREYGIDDQTINAALREATQSEAATPQTPPPQSNQPKTPVASEPKKLDAARIFIIIGSILIIAAVCVVIASQWSNVGPLARVLFLLIPNLILFGLALYANSRANSEDITEGTLATAIFMSSFTVATALYQFRILPEINASLFAFGAGIGLAGSGLTEWFGNKPKFAPLTLFYLFALTIFIVAANNGSSETTLWLLTGVFGLVTLLGFQLARNDAPSSRTYLLIGNVLTIFLLPISVVSSVMTHTSLSSEAYAAIFVIFGIIYLLWASAYWNSYQQNKNKTIYDLKRVLEELAPILIVLPYLFVGINHQAYEYLVMFLSLLVLLAAVRVRIRTLLPLGATGLIISILILTGKYFSNSLAWPVIIFLVGFLFIGLSFVMSRVRQARQESAATDLPFGLGEYPLAESQKSKASSSMSCLGFAGILLAVYLVYILFGLFSSSFFRH